MTLNQDPLLATPPLTLPKPTPMRVRLDDIEEADLTGAPNTSLSSMETHGLLEPVKLYRKGNEDALLGIGDGNRRVSNARKLNWTHIDAVVYDTLTRAQLAHLQLGLHTRTPNLVAEAKALKGLIQSGAGPDDEDLAHAAKLSVTRVRKLRKLLSLPSDILELTGSVLSEGVAESVANLSGEHRNSAVQLIRQRASEDKGRFTQADLKSVQLARDESLASLLTGIHVAMPVVTLSPVELLAAQVRTMCTEAGVSIEDLTRTLALNTAPVPLTPSTPEKAVPDKLFTNDHLAAIFAPKPDPAAEQLVASLLGGPAQIVDPWDVPAQPEQEVIESMVDQLIPRQPEVTPSPAEVAPVDPWDEPAPPAPPVTPPAPPKAQAQPPRFGTRSFGGFRGGAR
ncbi:ParB/RepB/Spo0J family partition protein (plasmid) [Deinococcus radiomollis]|uniref:ParB/RepB/Spo0J family partition protein n=1 Tax=Deinococcus radiomollis TaxID=468916 RepID=UPI00389157DF